MAPPAGCGGQADPPHLGPLVWPTLGVVANDGEQCVEAPGSWVGKSVPKQQGTKCVVLFLFLYRVQKKTAPIRSRRKLPSG